MAGFLVFDFKHRYEEAVARLAEWVRDGRLRYREDIVDRLQNCPGTIAGL
jgi:NADPH-dependent curcumin reductase CurA